MANEKVTLFGLPVIPRRLAPFGPIDPEHSRQLFIEQGLVRGDIDWNARFLQHNRQVLDELEARAAKTRRRELLVDEYTLYQFYDRRLPSDVYDVARLRSWLKRAPHDALRMTEEGLLAEDSRPTISRHSPIS